LGIQSDGGLIEKEDMRAVHQAAGAGTKCLSGSDPHYPEVIESVSIDIVPKSFVF
jgi:hypothetical protein